MIPAVSVLLLAGFSAALYGQDRPQLIWEGEVDETATIYIRGDKLTVESRGDGTQVRHAGYRFFDKLPDSNQPVQVRVAEGRGEVQVVAQPNLENGYTLAVRIVDRQEGSSFYSLAFFWDPGLFGSGDPFRRRKALPWGGFTGAMSWAGAVEGTVRVTIQGQEASARTLSGKVLPGSRLRTGRSLREAGAHPVELRKRLGRGRVDVIEAPAKKNGYRLVFEIADPGPGADEYEVEIGW